jgi:eukaryotic-like serine/threonine-protein kinase
MRDLLPESSMEGISCIACHATLGPVDVHAANAGGARYEGNATWTSFLTGREFLARPEDREDLPGIGNSGYAMDLARFLGTSTAATRASDPVVHARASVATKNYLRSSEFCGACHDVRLFGTDVVGRARGEHFKRLRNAYSEWRSWSDTEARAGRVAATCADCHMSLFPGICEPGGAGGEGCPAGSHFVARAPGSRELHAAAIASPASRTAPHYFTSVDLPLSDSFPDAFADDTTLDGDGLPLGLRLRRDLLLAHTFRFELGAVRREGATLEIPVVLENTGAGHRVPAGFSQEREVWVELTVTDARERVVYEVGHVASNDTDLADKVFLRVTTSDAVKDSEGRPLGVFGADVADGPDAPAWSPNPTRGGTAFRGRGLINLQNGFLRCVRCTGVIDAAGHCQAGPGQGRTRSDRYDDGAYDLDTGTCTSNLSGGEELFETFFPVGALDAERGVVRAPDAIVDTRSAKPGVPLTYTYVLPIARAEPPFRVEARLRFRAFPPYLIRAFADYETRKSNSGLRPSGPQVRLEMLRRIDIVDIGHATASIP